MIELDVQLTRDEKLVVLHDDTLERTTNGRGAVRDHTLAEIKGLDAGSWFAPQFEGEPVLTLPEVLALVGTAARVNVELKSPRPDWPVLVPLVLSTLAHHRAMESTIVSCFEPEALSLVRQRSVAARLGLLWQNPVVDEAWRWADDLGAVSIHPHWLLASHDLVRVAHARGVAVITWTVNEIEVMLELVRRGVDGIISDFPERLSVARNAGLVVTNEP